MRQGKALFITIILAGCGTRDPGASPAPLPEGKIDWHPAIDFLDSAVAAGAAPGAVLAVSYRGTRFLDVELVIGSFLEFVFLVL